MTADASPSWADLLDARGILPYADSGALWRQRREFSPGALIGQHWEVVDFLGEGGSAEVYGVRSTTSKQDGAVKVLRQQHAGLRAQFQREAEVVVSLESAWSVRLLDRGNLLDGRPFIVFERLAGRSLEALLRERKVAMDAPYFTLDELAAICHAVLSSLGELHEKDWVHRDIKPRNLQCRAGAEATLQVTVFDFGIAERVCERCEDNRAVLGSPHYVAPEVARGERFVPSSDLYSFGISLLELIAGEPPWAGRSADELLYCHMHPDLVVPIPAVVRRHALGPVIARAVSKSTEERFDSAMTMLAAVDDAVTVAGRLGLAAGAFAPASAAMVAAERAGLAESEGEDDRATRASSGLQRTAPTVVPPLLFDTAPVTPSAVMANVSGHSRALSVVLMVLPWLVVVVIVAVVVTASGLWRWGGPAQVVVVPDVAPQGVAVVPTSAGWSADVFAAQRVRAQTIEQARRVGMGTVMNAVALVVSDSMREGRAGEHSPAESVGGGPADGSSAVVHEDDMGSGAIRSSTRAVRTQAEHESF